MNYPLSEKYMTDDLMVKIMGPKKARLSAILAVVRV